MTPAKTSLKLKSGALMLALAMMASLWIPTLAVPAQAQAQAATVTLPALA